MSETVLEVKNLKKYFEVKSGLKKDKYIKAVDDVSFKISKGETLGIVGESGCGKSTLGRTIINLYPKTQGKILFYGKDTDEIKDRREFKKKVQMIFQDPYASLNPRMTVYEILEEPLRAHNIDVKKRQEMINKVIDDVGMSRSYLNRYPHEFSGGQRQRIGIARALILSPELIICDEPISALDVSIQAQVINMLKKFQRDYGVSYLFIAHDLSMVKYISDSVGVMYLGSMVEIGKKEMVFEKRMHPYTKALLMSAPIPNPRKVQNTEKFILEGEVPSPLNPPSGCKFRTRCNQAQKICEEECPKLKEVEPGYYVACHLYQ